MLSIYAAVQKSKATIRALRREIKSAQDLVMLDELKQRRRVLRRLDFISDEGIVTLKVTIAGLALLYPRGSYRRRQINWHLDIVPLNTYFHIMNVGPCGVGDQHGRRARTDGAGVFWLFQRATRNTSLRCVVLLCLAGEVAGMGKAPWMQDRHLASGAQLQSQFVNAI